MLMVSIRILADFGLHSCQTTRKLKRATTLEYTAILAIFIHCYGLGFYAYNTVLISKASFPGNGVFNNSFTNQNLLFFIFSLREKFPSQIYDAVQFLYLKISGQKKYIHLHLFVKPGIIHRARTTYYTRHMKV